MTQELVLSGADIVKVELDLEVFVQQGKQGWLSSIKCNRMRWCSS